MSESAACARARSCPGLPYLDRCDLFASLDGFHVVEVAGRPHLLSVVVESAPEPMGCRTCGVIAQSHGRRDVLLVDVPW